MNLKSFSILRKNIYAVFFTLFFFIVGLSILSGFLVPYDELPNESLMTWEHGLLFSGGAKDDLNFKSLAGKEYSVCNKLWIDLEPIHNAIANSEGSKIETEVKIETNNTSNSCLTVYELKSNDAVFYSIEDVKKYKAYVKYFFMTIAFIFLIVAGNLFLQLKKVIKASNNIKAT